MEEINPFENIGDDWYFCSSLNKECRFVSHILRGVTYFIVVEYRSGQTYDLSIKKPDIESFLKGFRLLDKEKEKSEDEIIEQTLKGDYSKFDAGKIKTPKSRFKDDNEKDEPVFLDEKGNKLPPRIVNRNGTQTIGDLRDQLFDAIQLVKEGKMKPQAAKDIANLAQVIINSAKVEIEYRKMADKNKTIKLLD